MSPLHLTQLKSRYRGVPVAPTAHPRRQQEGTVRIRTSLEGGGGAGQGSTWGRSRIAHKFKQEICSINYIPHQLFYMYLTLDDESVAPKALFTEYFHFEENRKICSRTYCHLLCVAFRPLDFTHRSTPQQRKNVDPENRRISVACEDRMLIGIGAGQGKAGAIQVGTSVAAERQAAKRLEAPPRRHPS